MTAVTTAPATATTPRPQRAQRLDAAGLARNLAGLQGDRLAITIDTAVVSAPIGAAICNAMPSGTTLLPFGAEDAPTLESATRFAHQLANADHVIAVGGGRTLDITKVAVALASAPDLEQRIAASDSGFVTELAPASKQLLAVPTTLGTGSERSQSAVIDLPNGRVIVAGPALRPAVYVLDGVASRGLPRKLVFGGIFEALTRTFGPAVGEDGSGTLDDIILATFEQLLKMAAALDVMPDPGGAKGDKTRAGVSQLSAMSHGPQLHRSRASSSFKAWFLVTELSWLADITKVEALARVLGPWWDAIDSGDTRWGSPKALSSLWEHIQRRGRVHGCSTPASWMANLLERWDLAPTGTLPIDPDLATARIVSRWGGAHLLGLGEQAVAPLVERAITGDPS